MSDVNVLHGAKPLFPTPTESLGSLLFNSLSRYEEPIALIDAVTKEYLSSKELLSTTTRLAYAFRCCNYDENTIIAVCGENSIHFFLPIVAALFNGMISTTLNSRYTVDELLSTVDISKPKVIFCTKDALSKIVEVSKSKTYIERIVLLDSKVNIRGAESMRNFINRFSQVSFDCLSFKPKIVDVHNQVAFILNSSGTTGLPKGVMMTHNNVLARYIQSLDTRFLLPPLNNTQLIVLPMFHGFSFMVTFESILKGNKIVVIPKFQEDLFLKSIEEYKISNLYIVPPIMAFLAQSPLVDKYNTSSIQDIIYGSSPLPIHIEEAVRSRIKPKHLRQAYGLTEVTLTPIGTPVGAEKPGSCGIVNSNASVKIRDLETGKSLGPMQKGELCVHGPLVMKGYIGNPEATQQTIDKNGWVLTGDVAYYDHDGYFYIVDRIKELIKYKSYQVPPAELEMLLLTHPKIKDAAVIGYPTNDGRGELPVAFVVVKPKHTATREEITKFINDKIAPFKKIRDVIFVQEIPKTAIGKNARPLLKKKLINMKSKL